MTESVNICIVERVDKGYLYSRPIIVPTARPMSVCSQVLIDGAGCIFLRLTGARSCSPLSLWSFNSLLGTMTYAGPMAF